ncbi:hypothetical protein JVT61DRAFT_5285 [Boletus reticuloceps]|uniref:Homeobox domain-containing protein n=1 Tax=Boletus reticuloceps TaxID=495285 RepID=A0A8I2Z132_9AGAM|nr:hypothetical protein JVT61DRAFT_5285 [Boletus reticuloceps]
MRTTARSTRRITPSAGKENLQNQRDSVPTPSSKKLRHRLSITELARLEDVFKQDTHPSRQQKKDLAAELGMDYKTVTIWFQNKRQTAKRGQPPPIGDTLEKHPGRTRADSCLRTVSSPSHNATLDAAGDDPAVDPDALGSKKLVGDGLNAIAAKAIVKIKPLLDSLNALTSRPRGRVETKDEAPDIDPHWAQTLSESEIASTESSGCDQVVEHEQAKGKLGRWKRIRTLEWACERQAKRRKFSREAYARLGSEEVEDHGDPDDARMDSALIITLPRIFDERRSSKGRGEGRITAPQLQAFLAQKVVGFI